MGKLGEGGGERWAVGGGRLSFTFLSKNARHSGPSDLLSQQSSAGGLLEIDGGFPSGYCSTVNASSTVIASSTTESACRCSACCGWERGRGLQAVAEHYCCNKVHSTRLQWLRNHCFLPTNFVLFTKAFEQLWSIICLWKKSVTLYCPLALQQPVFIAGQWGINHITFSISKANRNPIGTELIRQWPVSGLMSLQYHINKHKPNCFCF